MGLSNGQTATGTEISVGNFRRIARWHRRRFPIRVRPAPDVRVRNTGQQSHPGRSAHQPRRAPRSGGKDFRGVGSSWNAALVARALAPARLHSRRNIFQDFRRLWVASQPSGSQRPRHKSSLGFYRHLSPRPASSCQPAKPLLRSEPTRVQRSCPTKTRLKDPA